MSRLANLDLEADCAGDYDDEYDIEADEDEDPFAAGAYEDNDDKGDSDDEENFFEETKRTPVYN